MSDSSSSSFSAGGIGFVGLLAIVFIVLKLMHVIEWSWLWVLAPIWISILFWVMLISLVVWASQGLPNPFRRRRKAR